MSKFKEFYKKAANPRSAQDWLDTCHALPNFASVQHPRLCGEIWYRKITTHLQESDAYRKRYVHRKRVKYLHVESSKVIVVDQHTDPRRSLELFWYDVSEEV